MTEKAKGVKRKQLVMRARYGFVGEPRSMQEKGDELGVTRERIRQIINNSLRKLQSHVFHVGLTELE